LESLLLEAPDHCPRQWRKWAVWRRLAKRAEQAERSTATIEPDGMVPTKEAEGVKNSNNIVQTVSSTIYAEHLALA
jgi:hypothetical protein